MVSFHPAPYCVGLVYRDDWNGKSATALSPILSIVLKAMNVTPPALINMDPWALHPPIDDKARPPSLSLRLFSSRHSITVV